MKKFTSKTCEKFNLIRKFLLVKPCAQNGSSYITTAALVLITVDRQSEIHIIGRTEKLGLQPKNTYFYQVPICGYTSSWQS